MTPAPLGPYKSGIERDVKAGNATEHAPWPALKTLIEALAPSVTVTNEPEREVCGARPPKPTDRVRRSASK